MLLHLVRLQSVSHECNLFSIKLITYFTENLINTEYMSWILIHLNPFPMGDFTGVFSRGGGAYKAPIKC